MLLVNVVTGAQSASASQKLSTQLTSYLKQVDAEVGVAVVCDGRVVAKVNDGEQYPLMSVMKLFQAMWVAEKLERDGSSVDSMLYVSPSDLRPNTYSPLRDERPNGNFFMSVGELLDYSLQQSDNNACDILFRFSGGPVATNHYLRSLGYRHFAVQYTEDEMHRDGTLWAANWSRPSEAARIIYAIFNDSRFQGPAFTFVRHSLENCKTGQSRITAPLLPVGAVVAHKTGTGDAVDGMQHGINDVAHIVLPNGRRYALAVFIRRSPLDMARTEGIIASVSRIVMEWMMQ